MLRHLGFDIVLLLLFLRIHVIAILIVGQSMTHQGKERLFKSLIIYFALSKDVRNFEKLLDI